MTDIWDEKPEMDRIEFDCPGAEGFHSSGAYEVYHIKEMDAWLEKLKAYYDVTTNSGQVYEWKEKAEKWDFWIHGDAPPRIKHVEMVEGKLEAIKTAMCNAKNKHPSDRNMGRDFMYDVEEILGVE